MQRDITRRRFVRLLGSGAAASSCACRMPAAFCHPRCAWAVDLCRVSAPLLRPLAPRHAAACHLAEELS
jgi:hypothetical protein